MADRRIRKYNNLSEYLRSLDQDVTKLNNRNYVTSIAANAIGSDQIGENIVLDNKTISSSNYISGFSGWIIDGYGNAEFSNVYVRGDINASSGTIGYWNISQPSVTRTFGDYVLRGTVIESLNLGETDSAQTSGTYVALFKSYDDIEIPITAASRESSIATITVTEHFYAVGDFVRVTVNEDSSFNTNSAEVIDVSNSSFSYISEGSNVSLVTASGSSILAIKDVAGLYLRDYSKSEFDYGYFSNTGIAYVSAEDVNLIENPSFEYVLSVGTSVVDTNSWTAGAGITFTTEEFNDGTNPQYQYDSEYGGKVSWSSALSTYLSGKLDYAIGNSYNIYNSGRVLYLGMTIFPSYVPTRSTPTLVERYTGPSSKLYWKVTSNSHGLSGGDTALLDFDGVHFDTSLGEYVNSIGSYGISKFSGQTGFNRTYAVLSSPAPTSNIFYVDSGYTTSDTFDDGSLRSVDYIYSINVLPDLGQSDLYGTRPAYVYKVVNAAFNLADIRFRFANSSTVNISNVASLDTISNWDTESNKYYLSDPTEYALGYHNNGVGIPYMKKFIQIIVDANSLDANYKLLDSTGYANESDVYIDLPGWMYTHDGFGNVSSTPTKLTSFNYIVDNLYLATSNKSFFGGSLPNVRWYSSTENNPSNNTAQASIEATKKWIDVNLETQTAYLDYFNYVGFKQSNFSRSMFSSPNISTSDSISAKILNPTDFETLTVTSGIYRYVNSSNRYIDLSSSLKTVTGDRDTGFELIARRKEYLLNVTYSEKYALVAGYWDESANNSVIQISSDRFAISANGAEGSSDRLTVTSSGVVISGDLTVNGTTTTVNSTTVTVDDKNIELASTASPSDALADGAGITVKGTTDKTWSWIDATDAWTSNQDVNIVSPGANYEIAGTSVLNATTLGSGVINSSLTKIGALSGGTAGYVKVDASGNLTSTSSPATMASLTGYTSTAMAGGNTTLTNTSTYYQIFTGSSTTTQTVTLPVTSTLALGWTFHIVNNSTGTGNLTVNSSGGNQVIVIPPGATAMATCINIAVTDATGWEAGLTDFSTYTGTGSVVLSASPTFTGTVNTNAITAGGLASFNNNISAFGTTTLWANQQLSVAIRNGVNATTNLAEYSRNDTTVIGGRTSDGSVWIGSTTPQRFLNYTITAASASSTSVATYTASTVSTVNPAAVGQKIVVSGMTPSSYNGSYVVTAIGGSSGAWTITVTAGSGLTPFTVGSATGFGTFSMDPGLTILTASAGTPGLIIKSTSASQAANAFEYRRSDNSLQTYITPAGDFVAPAISAIWSITSSAQDVTVSAMRARTSVASGYRANLQTWENQTTVLAGVNASGQFFTGSTAGITSATFTATAASASSTTVATYTINSTNATNPFAVGQVVTTSGFTAEAYFNGTFAITAIGGSSGAWTLTVLGTGFTVASATVFGTISVNSQISSIAPSPAISPLKVRGAANQIASIFEVLNSGGSTLFYVNQFGNTLANAGLQVAGSAGNSPINAGLVVQSFGTGNKGIIVKATANTVTDLVQILDSSNNVLSATSPIGQLFTGGTWNYGSTTTAINAQTPTGTTNITITTAAAHGISVGQKVLIAGVTPSGYNGVWTAQSGTTGSTLIVDIGSNPGAITVAGTVAPSAQMSITPASVRTPGLIIKAVASQAGNLQEWQNSSGTVLSRITEGGAIMAPNFWDQRTQGTSAGIALQSSSSTVVTAIFRGAGSQSVDILQVQNSVPNTIFKVDQNGFMVAGGATVLSNALISASIYGTTQVGMAIRGTSGQTADLLVLQNNSTTSVSGFDSASNLFVNNTYYGFSVISAAPANTTYWKIATLPISGGGTYDHIIIDAILDDGWGSANKAHARILLANRNAFNYRYYLEGPVRTSARIVTYTEADGSVSVYLQASSGQYTSFSYNITHNISGSGGSTIYKNPASTTTAPTGTLSFDSGVIATYVPQIYVPYSGQPIINGLVNSSGTVTGASFVRTGGTSSQFLKADGSVDSSTYVATTSSYFAGHNPEGRLMYNTYLTNDIANARLRGSTLTATQNGVSYSISDANWDAMFDGTASFFNISPTSGFTFPLVITMTLPRTLTYGTWVGLSFGSTTFRANSVQIEVFSLDSSSWVTVVNTTTNTSEDIFAAVSGLTNGNATGINQIRYTISNPNSTQLRIQHLWAYNFNSDMWSQTMMPRAGGSFYGPITNTTIAPASVPLIVKGAASQSANLTEWQNSAGVRQGYVSPGGDGIIFPGVYANYELYVQSGGSSVLPLRVRGAASQSANLTEWQNSGGGFLAGVLANGGMRMQQARINTASALGTLSAVAESSTTIGAVIRGAASQSANLQEWQTSTPTTVASISSAGAFTATGDISTGGVLKSTFSSGDEGGQLDLAKSVTNTTLTTGVSIDVYQDKLRFFETGGTNRGFYIDISSGGASAGTNLVSGGGSFTGGTLTSNLTLAAGTTSLSPLTFQSGTNLTTVTAGAIEYDGTVFYQTSNATTGRALEVQEYVWVCPTTGVSLDFTANTTAKSIINGGTKGLVLVAGTTYEFELYMTVTHNFVLGTSQAGTFGLNFTTVSGSPTNSPNYQYDTASNTAGFGTAMTLTTLGSQTTGTHTFSAAITTGSRYSIIRAKGVIRVTGTGTSRFYPYVSVNNVNADNGWVVNPGSFLKVKPVGNGTISEVGGAWS